MSAPIFRALQIVVRAAHARCSFPRHARGWHALSRVTPVFGSSPRSLPGTRIRLVSTAGDSQRVPPAEAINSSHEAAPGAHRTPSQEKLKTEAAAAAEDLSDERERVSRVQALKEEFRKTWSLADPLHMRFLFSELLTRSKASSDPDIVLFLSRSLSMASYAVTVLMVAGTLGLDTKPILALGSAAGVTLGFALRDFATNFLSGLLLVATRPFRRGDYIIVTIGSGKVEGYVELFDTRWVHLRLEEPLNGSGNGVNSGTPPSAPNQSSPHTAATATSSASAQHHKAHSDAASSSTTLARSSNGSGGITVSASVSTVVRRVLVPASLVYSNPITVIRTRDGQVR